MKNFERILIAIFCLSILVKSLIPLVMPDTKGIGFALFGIWIIPFVLGLFYSFRFKFSIYSVVLVLLGIGHLGIMFKTMHWPYAGILLLLNLLAYIFTSFVFIRSGLLKRADKRMSGLNLSISLLMIVQMLMPLWSRFREFIYVAEIVNYATLALILVVLIREINKKAIENKVLVLLAMYSSVYVVGEVILLYI